MNKGISLLVRDLTFPGQRAPLIEIISIEIEAGEFVSILGPTGAGKSTLLRVIAGLETRYSGEVTVDGRRIVKPSREVQIVFQDLRLLPWKTVQENMFIAAPRDATQDRMLTRARELLDELGLSGFEKTWPRRLSGGQRAGLAFARAFMDPPKVLLLDEPFSGLDLRARCKLRESLTEATLRRGTTTVMVSHSIDDAVFLSDRIIVLSGRPLRLVRAFAIDMPRKERKRFAPELMEREAAIGELLLELGDL